MLKIHSWGKASECLQPEDLLGNCMLKYGQELGEDSTFGRALTDMGEAMKLMAEVKESFDINVKETFIDPLQLVHDEELKQISHHLKRLEGRRLDYDYKRRHVGKIPDNEITQAMEKFEESKAMAERCMFNFLENDGIEAETRACALDQIQARDASVHKLTLYPLSQTGEGTNGATLDLIEAASSLGRNDFMPHPLKRCPKALNLTTTSSAKSRAYFEQKAFCSDACVGDFCFSANPHQQQRNECGEEPWKEAMDGASFVSRCSFSLSLVPSASREVGEDLQYNSELPQHQATLNTEELDCGSEISQEFLSGKSHHQSGECENAASHNLKVVQCQGMCSAELICECNKCRKVFIQNLNIIRHKIVHTGKKPYECNECGKFFRKRRALIKHQRFHTGEKPYECRHCGKFFSYKSTLKQHNKVHIGERPYKCRECGVSFSQRPHLNVHLRVHIGEKPYECTECGKSFCLRANLARHLRVHTGEKLYECRECGISFPRRYHLTDHLKVHTGGKPYPYECRECGMSFRLRAHLTVHLRVHTGENPYACRECGMSFCERDHLIEHQTVHTGEKPYKCRECGMSFRRRAHLTDHLRIHNGGKPYECTECGKSFTQKNSLSKHLRVHTGEKF
ncbi:Zinc finger protein 211 [Myotis davidii]|uniref:Zinc finger protein 211 n=1 Tax=Myotis davidii TaxID=225400 RepID=L5LNR1_MYODS|nr:Zinc finger protein 211 [Myotis davidii]